MIHRFKRRVQGMALRGTETVTLIHRHSCLKIQDQRTSHAQAWASSRHRPPKFQDSTSERTLFIQICTQERHILFKQAETHSEIPDSLAHPRNISKKLPEATNSAKSELRPCPLRHEQNSKRTKSLQS